MKLPIESKAGLCQPLEFFPVDQEPEVGGPFDAFLILNPCDGFHLVYGRWEDGKFVHFADWMGGQGYNRDFYIAWARLPNALKLVEALEFVQRMSAAGAESAEILRKSWRRGV